ncbi:hypothetical protein PLICRDRAFT_175901 [Plicaturopsis crispa FD-325 SS-3]|nr:hypothetical protein PLICRDRAFT_175901 [Plicaturopsis crispa FD-325 SS-3]
MESANANPPPPQPQSEPPKSTADPPKQRKRQKKQAEPKQPRRPAPAAAAPSTTAAPSQESPRLAPRGAPLQPYPGPGYHIMSPPYPSMNGSPYQPPTFTAHNSPLPNGSSGPGIPAQPPQYPYPMHPSAYPPTHPAYPPYNQYPQHMMMYPPARPSAPQENSTSNEPSPAPGDSASSGKRKRKSLDTGHKNQGTSDDEAAASGSDIGRAQSTQQQSTSATTNDNKKRTKTQRACDSCRSRKIRCDVLADSDTPTCQHCKQYGFECTFFLPITETRFKKKKLDEQASTAHPPGELKRTASSPRADSFSKGDVGVYGPTSPAHLLHSQASIHPRIYESYDSRWHHTWEVSKTGDGLIQVVKQPLDQEHLALPKPLDLHIEEDVVKQLINAYFKDVAPILPIVTEAEFLATPSPAPILLYSMCLVAAARREVPQSVFDSIRYIVNAVIKSEDVLSTASIVNVQALLILCMTGDCHSMFVPNALSALWVRLGSAIRMAQDLGLHRAESVKQNVDLRRRLWGACVISDRWTSLTYGHPYMIDVQDCDARLPSSDDPNDLYMDELVRLSVILGRVLKTIYSPSGLTLTSDDILNALLADLDAWKNNLPDSLKFRGRDSSRSAGILHLFYSCVCMIFWRVFMRISYTCPAHLKFGLTVEKWSGLVELTGQSIDWLDAHEQIYDVWLLVAYASTSCALVQYHTWARRKDQEAAAKLRVLRDCVRRWEGSISPDHMSARRKTAEIIALLYEATQGPPQPIEAPALNPTGGVTGNQPLRGLTYEKDPSRPGSGVFIAHGKPQEGEYDRNIAPGTVINSPSEDESVRRPAVPASAPSTENHSFFTSSAFAPPLPAPGTSANFNHASERPTSSSSMVNFTPLGGERGSSNVNPAMDNVSSGNVQVMNVLDHPQASNNTLEQFAITDNGFLEGIPGGMFDWGQWDTFFARFNAENGGAGGAAALQQAQREHQQQQQGQQQPTAASIQPGARLQANQFQYPTNSGGA